MAYPQRDPSTHLQLCLELLTDRTETRLAATDGCEITTCAGGAWTLIV